jgi:hypothetical protein
MSGNPSEGERSASEDERKEEGRDVEKEKGASKETLVLPAAGKKEEKKVEEKDEDSEDSDWE